MPGARCTRGPCAKVESTRVVTTGSPGHPAFPCATVLTVSSGLSLVTGLVCHHRRRNCFRQLDASVGASGPHGFAVRISAVRYRHIRVHRIPSRVRDDREPPLWWDETARVMKVIWVGSEGRIFLAKGLDTDLPICPSGVAERMAPPIHGRG